MLCEDHCVFEGYGSISVRSLVKGLHKDQYQLSMKSDSILDIQVDKTPFEIVVDSLMVFKRLMVDVTCSFDCIVYQNGYYIVPRKDDDTFVMHYHDRGYIILYYDAINHMFGMSDFYYAFKARFKGRNRLTDEGLIALFNTLSEEHTHMYYLWRAFDTQAARYDLRTRSLLSDVSDPFHICDIGAEDILEEVQRRQHQAKLNQRTRDISVPRPESLEVRPEKQLKPVKKKDTVVRVDTSKDHRFNPELVKGVNILMELPPQNTPVVYLLLSSDSDILKLGYTETALSRMSLYMSSRQAAGYHNNQFTPEEDVRMLWYMDAPAKSVRGIYNGKAHGIIHHMEKMMKQFFATEFTKGVTKRPDGYEWFDAGEGFDLDMLIDALNDYVKRELDKVEQL